MCQLVTCFPCTRSTAAHPSAPRSEETPVKLNEKHTMSALESSQDFISTNSNPCTSLIKDKEAEVWGVPKQVAKLSQDVRAF